MAESHLLSFLFVFAKRIYPKKGIIENLLKTVLFISVNECFLFTFQRPHCVNWGVFGARNIDPLTDLSCLRLTGHPEETSKQRPD